MFTELLQTCRDKYGTSSASIGLAQWITENTTLKRKAFTFKDYPFQHAIADDDHPNLYCEKPSQVGMTEVQVRKFLAILRRNQGTNGIFTLPNEKMFRKLYNGRLKPIVEADQIFNPPMATTPVRRADMVQIGDSFGYISGCTEGDATSTSADLLMHDELDLSPMDMIGLFQSRLQNSDMKMTQAFSTPSFVDYGIDRGYQLSDQREYMIKCSACNEHQIPDFTHDYLHIPKMGFEVEKLYDASPEQVSSLDLPAIYVKCIKCHSRLDLGNASNREWVAAYPSRTAVRGYKVRPFSTSRIAPGYIFTQLLKYKQQDYVRGFVNTTLGDPFTAGSAQLQRSEIERVMSSNGNIPHISSDTPVFLGLDVGQVCHLTLQTTEEDSGRPHFVLFEQVPIFQINERLAELRKIYSIVQGCVDRQPYTPEAERMRENSHGIIMPVNYGGKATILAQRDEFGTISHYFANRTAALDRVKTVVVNQEAVLSGYGPYKETIIGHLRDMVREDNPEQEAVWKKLNTNGDHFFHSMALALLARRICEHMYMTADSTTFMSSAVLMGLPMAGNQDVNIIGNGGAARIARFGAI